MPNDRCLHGSPGCAVIDDSGFHAVRSRVADASGTQRPKQVACGLKLDDWWAITHDFLRLEPRGNDSLLQSVNTVLTPCPMLLGFLRGKGRAHGEPR